MLHRIKNLFQNRGGSGPQILDQLSDEAFVQKMFQLLLHRRADPTALNIYRDFLQQGNSRSQLIDILTKSDEFSATNDHFIVEEFPSGNFASAIPSKEDIQRCKEIDRNPVSITGINLRADKQFELLQTIKPFYDEMPHHQQTAANQAEYRYVWNNPSYSPSDAIATYGMMRHFRPQKIVEIGCGNSSCLMLDTNDRFFDGDIDFTLVEPYPEFLHSVLWPNDQKTITIIPEKAQDVPPIAFESLEENDILFIDSSHVSKAGSDVNYLYLEILPRIKPGVLVHIHDVDYPFEYRQEWLEQGRYWNEAYLLRALLTDNPTFEILLFNTYLIKKQPDWIAKNMPRFNEVGGSIWLRRTAGN